MNVGQEFDNMTQEVFSIMREDLRARNDDKWLLFRVWQRRTNIVIPFEDFSKLPMPETVSRVRRKIQNTQGVLQPTVESVRRNRQMRQEQVQDWWRKE